jgi:ABC-2 type transport system permease protein
MKTIVTIFRRELGAYLNSALGYIVAAVILFLDGLLFYTRALRPSAGPQLSSAVVTYFFQTSSVLVAVAAVVLSIRLLAEERQAGTMVLLKTSPVHDSEIVLGKFLSAFVFLAGITLLSAYIPLLVMVNGKISAGHIAVGYLGLLLFGGAVLAIGTFASALSRYQLVAAVIGGAITGVMFLFWELASMVDPPLTRVFQELAIHGTRFSGFQAGILQLKNVIYYLSVTGFFLFLTTKTLEIQRWE